MIIAVFYYIVSFINFFRKQRIKVVLKNNDIIVLDKHYDMKINSNNKTEITVQTLLKRKYPWLANDKLSHEFYFPHRLDYATSGLMCIPMNKEVCRTVSNLFFTQKSKKFYIAIVRGLFSREIIDVNMALGEDIREQAVQKMCTADSNYCRKSRSARTLFVILENGLFGNYPASKILIRPVTGRRHQIRVHCSYLGHTVVGDYTYSNRKDINPSRMFLHSIRLVLPYSSETIDVETVDPFTEVTEWKMVTKINEIDRSTYDKLEKFL